MGPGGWIILSLFLVVVVTIIVINVRSHSEEPTPTPVLESEQKSILLDEKPNYKTIYKFTSKEHAKVCRYCDGETPLGSDRCSICGKEFDW